MRTILLFSCFVLALLAQAESGGTVTGRVVDELQMVVAGATVRLEPGARVAITDAGGRFRLEALPLTHLTLTVTAKGFFSGARAEVNLSAVPSQEIEIVLQRQSVLEQSVVVTGTGTQSLIVEAPVRTELISRELVQAHESRTLSDALTATVPGVRIENNCQNCGWSAVRLNGMEGQYTQVLEDGLPTVSGANMVYALDQLPTEFFENVEVVKGGVSSLYGPNAVAGVINMVRREPQANMFQVDLSSGQYKGRPEHTGGFVAQLNDIWKGWSGDFYYRGLRRAHADLDRDGFTELTRHQSDAGGGTLFRRFLGGNARLTLGGSTLEDFRRGGDRLDVPPDQTNITEQIASSRSAGFVRWNHTVNPNFYYNLSTSLSHMKRASYYGAGLDPNAYGSTRNPLSATDASAGYQAGRHTLSVGYQYWFEHVSDIYTGYNRANRMTFTNSGTYLQDEWRVTPRVVLLGGFRVDKSNLLDHWVLSPRGNVRFGLTRSLNFRVGVSTGFRPPQIFDEDMHIAAVGGEAMFVRFGPGLKEESSRSLTSALDYVGRLGGGSFQAGASFFWTRLGDVFQLRETDLYEAGNRVFERINGSGSRFRGLELSTNWQPSKWLGLRGGATFQQARYDEPESTFGSLRYFRTPNRYGYAGVDVDLPHGIEWLNSFDFTGSMRVPHYAGFIAADLLETSPSFGVWNIVVSKEWPWGASEKHKVRLYVRGNNLFDSFQPSFDQGPDRDSTYMYGPLTPRSAVVGVKVTF